MGCNLNPDPSGGHGTGRRCRTATGTRCTRRSCELDVPAMIHVSAACNPNFHTTTSHYLGADTTAFIQLLTSSLFADFPGLRFIIPHGGGAVPYHWGRFRGIAQDLGLPPAVASGARQRVVRHLRLPPGRASTCWCGSFPTDNILFASEMLGAVRGVDPETGHHFDDTRRYLEAAGLTDAERDQIYDGNARRVFPRLAV